MALGPLVRLIQVSKIYPENSVQACDRVSLDIFPGEIHGLIGENGAGKSTLMKILAGVVPPDSGTLQVNGAPLSWGSAQAWNQGIAMVSQQPLPVSGLTLAELVLLEDPRFHPFRPVSRSSAAAHCSALAKPLGWNLPWNSPCEDLPWTELLKARLLFLSASNKKVIILDEPTTSLPPIESEQVLKLMQTWTNEGRAVVFITHRLAEIAKTSHRVTLMHTGAVAKAWGPGEFTLNDLQVAFSASGALTPTGIKKKSGKVVWSMESLWASRRGLTVLKDFSLNLHEGEILGLAALQGPGLQALEDLLTGQLPPDRGSVTLDGQKLTRFTPKSFRKAGLGWVTADRLQEGSSGESTVLENLMALRLKDISRGGILSSKKSWDLWSRVQGLFSLPPKPHQRLNQLSGGNLQRVMVAREWEASPKVMILSEPSWGLDAPSRKTLGDRARDLASSGGAVLVISSDIGELLELCDRLAVLSNGKLAGDRPTGEWNPLEISKLLTEAD